MNKDTVKFLKEVADNVGIEISVYEGYSGRGMFGRTTEGITLDNPNELLGAAISEAFEVGVNFGLNGGEGEPRFDMSQIAEDIQNLRQDNMGLQTIIY